MAKKLITIPTVVHVVYRSEGENISDAQVKSQIKALNDDFRAKNTDKSKVPAVWQGLVTDSKIQFALATKSPRGKKTNGITRTATTVKSFGPDDTVKSKQTGGVNPWPTQRYLNIWVCSLGGGLLGYGQFPGGPAATDGVVILNTAFGTNGTATAPFNKGRTATHEVGHFLNLRHIWGDRNDCSGTDFVADTPAARAGQRRQAEVPADHLQQRPRRRHVHELHGLRRRRGDGHVHGGPGGAHERDACRAAKEARPSEMIGWWRSSARRPFTGAGSIPMRKTARE